MTEEKKNTTTTTALVVLAMLAYITLVVAKADPRVIGAVAGAAALAALNWGLKMELKLEEEKRSFWTLHPLLEKFHHRLGEGEVAGILTATVVGLCLWFEGVNFHLPIHSAATLIGIMSAARLAVPALAKMLGLVEVVSGKTGVIVCGSLMAAFTGPAAAVFLGPYLTPRVKEQDRGKVATGLAATIGSGMGALPYAAPPILIVWPTLQENGWTLGKLVVLVGGGSLLHVILSTTTFVRNIQPRETLKKEAENSSKLEIVTAVVLLGIVLANIFFAGSWLVTVVNLAVGVVALKKVGEDDRWQAILLGVLLMGLDVIGVQVDPAIKWLGQQIPTNGSAIAIATIIWLVTAWTSHVADNALASRIFLGVALAIAAKMGGGAQDLLILAVLLGALFRGFLLIPANLPNFAIAKLFRFKDGWVKTALFNYYWTGIAHLAWLAICYYFILRQ